MINIDDRLLDKLDCQETYLALQIARHVGKDGTAWPGITRLVKLTGWSKNTVLKVRKRLYGKSIVVPTKRYDSNGRDRSTIYRLSTPLIGIFITSDKINEAGGAGNEPRGSNGDQGRVQEMNPEGAGNEPEVLTSISINHKEERGASAPNPSLPKVKDNLQETEETIADQAAAFVLKASGPVSDPDHFGSPAPKKKHEGGSEADYEAIYSTIAEHLNGNKGAWKGICGLAKCTMTGQQFIDELQAWVRYYMSKPHLFNRPVQSLRGGPVSFIGWLKKPWAQEKYNPQVKATVQARQRSGPVRRTITAKTKVA